MNKEYTFTYFFISFVMLNLVDALTTCSILSLGGVEVNFLPALIIERHGMPGFFLFKVLAPISLSALCFKKSDIWDFLLVLFALICAWNTAVLTILVVELLSIP